MNKLSPFLQEEVLCLLCFSDIHFSLARHAVTPELFDTPYKEVVVKALDYIDTYNKPPKDHIATEIEPLLAGEKGEVYRQTLLAIFSSEKNLNSDYVIKRLTDFVRLKQFEAALYDAAELGLQKGKLDEAQAVMDQIGKTNLVLFDPGIKITDLHLLARSLEEEDIFASGVKALDDMKVGPARKQVIVYLGAKSTGKSWAQICLGRISVMTGLKVAHITIEISREVTQMRYIQSLLGISRWQMGVIKAPLFKRDPSGQISGLDRAILTPRSLDDPDILEYISNGLKKFGPKLEANLRIKEYAPGQLTIHMLQAYLDGLQRSENFIPDIVIIDPAYNMKLTDKLEYFRVSLGRLYVDLRGIAVDRNIAISTCHQINREGAKAKVTTGEHISEDWSILGTVDTGIIYNRRPMEERNKIARLWVDRGRSQRSRFFVLIAQNYDTGQFCLDSQLLGPDYDPNIDLFSGSSDNSNGNLSLMAD